MKAIVCGGRQFSDYAFLSDLMYEAKEKLGLTTIIQGEARGADLLAKKWAIEAGLDVIGIRADWDRHGRRAGYLRNVEMADLNPDYIIAFRGGRGTQMMIDIGERRGIRVFDIPKLMFNK